MELKKGGLCKLETGVIAFRPVRHARVAAHAQTDEIDELKL